MNCEDTRPLLSRLVAGELVDEKARDVREHVDACPHCARIVEQKEQVALMMAGVDAPRDMPDSPELDAEQRQEMRRGIPLRLGVTTLVLLGIAAAVVLGLTRPWEGPDRDPYRPAVQSPLRSGIDGAPAEFDTVLRIARGRPPADGATERPPLRELAARSDVVVYVTTTDLQTRRVHAAVREVLAGHPELLYPVTVGGARGASLNAPADWEVVTSAVLFLVRGYDGLPKPVDGYLGVVPVPLDDVVPRGVVAAIVRGEVPSKEALRVLVEAEGAHVIARLERDIDLRGRVPADTLARVARDQSRAVESAPEGRARATELRRMAAVLRAADSPPLDEATLRRLHDELSTLPPDSPRDRLAHLRHVAPTNPAWAVSHALSAIEVGASYLDSDPGGASPEQVLVPLEIVGRLDAAAAGDAANDLLLRFPSREISRRILDVALDVAPERFGPDVLRRVREEEWGEPAHVLDWYADLLVRIDAPEATEHLSSLLPRMKIAAAQRKASFVDALSREGPGSPAARILPTVLELALEAEKGEELAFLLRCYVALGGDFEDLREHACDLLEDPDEVSVIARQDLVRAVQEATGQVVMPWRHPGEQDVLAAAKELARRLR